MAADRIAIAQPAPPHCSGCYQQKPQETHVDFGAAYDGPVVPALAGSVGVVGHSIDELVLCSTCIRTAAALIGLHDQGPLIAERDQLEAGNRTLRGELAGYRDYVERLEGRDRRPPGSSGDARGAAPPGEGQGTVNAYPANSLVASGSVTAPGVNGVIASIVAPPEGVYEVIVHVTLTGTAETALTNLSLRENATPSPPCRHCRRSRSAS
jgi:hypothetical protein